MKMLDTIIKIFMRLVKPESAFNKTDEKLVSDLHKACNAYNRSANRWNHISMYLYQSGKRDKHDYFSEIRVQIDRSTADELIDDLDFFDMAVFINGKLHLRSYDDYIDAFIQELKLYDSDYDLQLIDEILELKH